MPVGTPYIPEEITVHLGRPNQDAPNVTVSFPDYIKNVASSEIYPSWPETALRANIYAIITFALNRVYTEWYRSRGYDFTITKFEDTVYPKNFGMIGISDEKFEIVYLWIYAPDLDYICETNRNEIKEMNEFIEYHFSLQ